MTKTKRLLGLALPLVALALTACATKGYECVAPYACNSVRHNYNSAVHDDGWRGWQAGQPGEVPPKKGQRGADQVSVAASGGLAGLQFPTGGGTLAGPVYTPPQPWRVWLAPYSRADGTLESGTYIWFTTPGHWTYLGKHWIAPPMAGPRYDGTTLGGDGGDLGPIAPAALGFTPGKALAPKGVLSDITQPVAGN
ncbi:MAG TPA: TraV family lipoprotein [Nevskiaceae bacterium]